jgi:hypothetical protein
MTGELRNLLNVIAAAGGLGTAAFGLVDGSKVFWGGVSNIGFGHVERALKPFDKALTVAVRGDWKATLRSHWLNGAAISDQKATAKSLIRLGLRPADAETMARATAVEPAALKTAATKLDKGTPLTPTDINALGRFDASVDAQLDAGFERADQQYRNVAKTLAGAAAVLLAAIAGGLLWSGAHGGGFSLRAYLISQDFLLALLVGAIAVPIAPVAKDLVSSLSAAAQAVKSTKS